MNSFDIKKCYDKNNRQYKKYAKRNRLIKKLFYSLAKDSLNKKIVSFISFRIIQGHNYSLDSYAETKYYDTKEKGVKSIKITFALLDIKTLANKGIGKDYYDTRARLIDEFIIHNRKKCIRFILYHELYHAKQRLQNKKKEGIFNEIQADRFALDKIKGGIDNVYTLQS